MPDANHDEGLDSPSTPALTAPLNLPQDVDLSSDTTKAEAISIDMAYYAQMLADLQVARRNPETAFPILAIVKQTIALLESRRKMMLLPASAPIEKEVDHSRMPWND